MKLKVLSLLCAFAASASVAVATDNGTRQAVEAGVSKGLGRFLSTYSETGMAGVQEAVTACYEDQKFNPTIEGTAACASMDKRAKDEDAVFSSQYGTPKVRFFTGSQPTNRMKAALKKLRLTAGETREFLAAINGV